MTDSATKTTTASAPVTADAAKAGGAAEDVSLLNDPSHILVGKGGGICLFNKSDMDVLMQLPLPGIVIFVHGVNSDGEWYSQAEEGLCKGLNDRLRRNDENLKFNGAAAGQLHPTGYMDELTPDGFINPKLTPKTFIQPDGTFSPVIRFRWGYKANSDELQKYGASIYLNEQNYWGGGPFANGCTTLPDLWTRGISENLFLWLHVQHLNPTNDRQVYSAPPRPYYVLAALRLARLIESLRQKQADVPITIVCHSQGNMVALAAAFIGDTLHATDAAGRSGSCVADSYVMCNAPYSLLKSNGTESWTSRDVRDAKGRSGRQTEHARKATLKAFFDIIRKRGALEQDAARIDKRMANPAHGFTAQLDRTAHGYQGKTYGRVTLYCNPHDQVISSSAVQGIGWRGMDDEEIAATNGAGVFTQRVFAQGFKVGTQGYYHYWHDHYRNKPEKPLKPGSADFWFPHSPNAAYSVTKGKEANPNVVGRILTYAAAPALIVALNTIKIAINALPPHDKGGWKIPLQAPPLAPFLPTSLRYGQESAQFDEGYDPPGQARDKARVRSADDPYAGDRPISPGGTPKAGTADTDAALGNTNSEAALRYEHHALLRMKAKREGFVATGEQVVEEDKPETATEKYKAWRKKELQTTLQENVRTNATDHSTIMTNGRHAQKALAYDVAIGVCDILEEDLQKIRRVADWRLLDGLSTGNSHALFFEYFDVGKFKGKLIFDWANTPGDGQMPNAIVDEREYVAPVERNGP